MISALFGLIAMPFLCCWETVSECFDVLKRGKDAEKRDFDDYYLFIPAVVWIFGVGLFLYTIIMFLVKGHLFVLWELFKTDFFGNLDSIWTLGETGNFYKRPLVITIGCLFLAGFLLTNIRLYLKGSMKSKVANSIFLVLCITCVVMIRWFVQNAYKEFEQNISYEDRTLTVICEKLATLTNNKIVLMPEELLYVIGVVACIMLLISFVILAFSHEHYKTLMFATACYFGIFPLYALGIQNILGLIAVVIIAIIVFIASIFINRELDNSMIRSEYKAKAESARIDAKKLRKEGRNASENPIIGRSKDDYNNAAARKEAEARKWKEKAKNV